MNNNFFQYYKPKILIPFLVFIGLLFHFGNTYISTHWGVSVSIVSVISGLIILINQYLWNTKAFSWIFWTIDISGIYEGVIEYRDIVNDEVTKKKAVVSVFQNGSSLKLTSTFGENGSTDSTASKSLTTNLIKDEFGNFELIFTFINDGNQQLNFSPYYGTNVFRVIRKNGKVESLEGDYYTNRKPMQTKGTIKVNYISKIK